MFLSSPQWIFVAALPIVQGVSQAQTTSAPSLLDLFPKCASTCIVNFILSEYPWGACSKGCDLGYLCRTNTTNGYTLGEAALRCSLENCSVDVALKYDSYTVCDSISGAIPPSHTTIVATIMSEPPPSTTSHITTTKSSKTLTQTSKATPITKSNFSGTQTEHPSTTITEFQSPLTVTSSAEESSVPSDDQQNSSTLPSNIATNDSPKPSSSASSRDSSLNPGAVIGVSVASGVSAFFIFCVVIFFCCRRVRRKSQKDRDRVSFEIGGVMSEPPDFTLPPPPRVGPNASFGTFKTESDSVRLVSDAEPPYRAPAHIVGSRPDGDYSYGDVTRESTERIDFPLPSNTDFEPTPSESSRTVSDLLPEKPTYELYPRPLRWSLQKKSRPISDETLFEFEENVVEPNSFLRHTPQRPEFSSLAGQTDRNGRHNRHPKAGLPANPRAMLHGFDGSRGDMISMKRKPVSGNAREKVHPSSQAAAFDDPSSGSSNTQTSDQDSGIDNYWQNPEEGFVGARVVSSRNAARRSYYGAEGNTDLSDDFEHGFETIDINSHSDMRRERRHSGSFRPLTPVREIRTPPRGPRKQNGEKIFLDHMSMKYPVLPVSGPLNPAREVVSRPRIVRQDDIKRVQIRRGRPQPMELRVPYCPDDYYMLGYNQGPPTTSQASRNPNSFMYASDKMMSRMPKKKPLPSEQHLKPLQRGSDLILQVE